MRPARDRIRFDFAQERIALAQKAPQERIDEALRPRARQRRSRVHRVIDDGKGRRAHVQQLIDRDGDETMQRGVRDRLGRELLHQRVERAPVPQRAVRELEDQ
jgi:hypothetical protein